MKHAFEIFSDRFGGLEDMGYDSDPFREVLRSQNNVPVIPRRKNRKIIIEYDKAIYKLRKRIE